MNNGFYPGGLAVIKNARHECNIGKTVQLVFCSNEQFITFEGYVNRNTKGVLKWVIEANDLSADVDGVLQKKNIGIIPQAWLMPLSGDFSHETEKEELVNAQ